MQTQVETFNRYNNAFDALFEAKQLVEQLEREASRILNNNTEPIMVRTNEDAERAITTPDDLEQLPGGTVIIMDGVEYMRTGRAYGPWVSFAGYKHSHDEMFHRVLDPATECKIIR